MGWSAPISSGDVVAIHAALVPSYNGYGEILMVGGDNHDHAAAKAGQFDHCQRMVLEDGSMRVAHTPAFDLFCCGHAILPDASVLFAGGTEEYPAEAEGPHHGVHFDGHRHAAIYNTIKAGVEFGTFSVVSDMGPQPGQVGGGGRWYPTLCTLGTGEVYAFQGHPLGTDTRHGNSTPEIYKPAENRWVMLPAIGDVSAAPILYPRVHVMSDGRLFVTSSIPRFTSTLFITPGTSEVQPGPALPDVAYLGYDCPSVLLPLVPGDGYAPRVLLCGGMTSEFIDVRAPGATWRQVPRSGPLPLTARIHACATLLPTGDVLLTGGTIDVNHDQEGVFRPELYATPLDATKRTYTGDVGSWTTIDEPASVLRNYHSTALLLPDGRVWTGGGSADGQPEIPPGTQQKLIEIYSPPYPAGQRPRIVDFPVPFTLGYGIDFDIHVASAAAIGSVVLMRCGSSTHAQNTDQRCIYLKFDRTGDRTLVATAPPNGNVAPPGPYMLFIVDQEGRPCESAPFVVLDVATPPRMWWLDGQRVVEDFGFYRPDRGWRVVGVGDFNGDGVEDIFWRRVDESGEVRVWIVNAERTAVVADIGLKAPDPGWTAVGVGDFDGDGKADLLWRRMDTGEVRIWLLDGAQVEVLDLPERSDPGWKVIGVADFDGDGKADILWRRSDDSGEARIWLLNGSGPVQDIGLPAGDPGWKVVGVGDFNGDGKADLLWRRSNDTGEVRLWLLDGRHLVEDIGLVNGDAGWKVIGVGDFDGDGKADIFWRRRDDSGEARIWILDGREKVQDIGLKPAAAGLQAVVGDFNGDGKTDLVWFDLRPSAVSKMSCTVTPKPPPVDHVAANFTVHAHRLDSGAPVSGQVLVNGQVVGPTDAPLKYTFRTTRRHVAGELQVVYPTGLVRSAGFDDAPIDFGWADA